MAGIDESKPFLAINIAVLTVSDTRTLATDTSGQILVDRIQGMGHKVAARLVLTDDVPKIVSQLKAWIDDPAVDCIITTGGTGVTGRDVTPEAFKQVCEKEIPDSASCSVGSASRASALRPFSHAPPRASPTAPICSRCRDRTVRSRTAGTRSSSINSMFVTSPAISSS